MSGQELPALERHLIQTHSIRRLWMTSSGVVVCTQMQTECSSLKWSAIGCSHRSYSVTFHSFLEGAPWTYPHTIDAFLNLLYTPPTLFTNLQHHSQLPGHQSHIHSHLNPKTLHLLDCMHKTNTLFRLSFFLMKLVLSESLKLFTIPSLPIMSGKVFKEKRSVKKYFTGDRSLLSNCYILCCKLEQYSLAECLMAQTLPFWHWRISGQSVAAPSVRQLPAFLLLIMTDYAHSAEVRVTLLLFFLKCP